MTSVLDPRVRVHYAGQQAPPAVIEPVEAQARWNWQQDAACRGTDGTFFFPPERERETARVKRVARAKAVCRECPVMADCRAYALQVGEPFGVWGGLLGSALLLARHRWAVIALGVSMLGAVLGIGYQLMNPAPIADMHKGMNAAMPYVIIIVAVGLFLYARAMEKKGVLS